jgi:hypothetical protein
MVSNMVQHPSSWFVNPWRRRWRALKRLGTTYRVMQFCDPQLHCFESLKTCTFLSSIKAYRKSQQDATVSQNLLFHVYVKLNMFRAKHCPSSGAQNCTSSLWFCIRERSLDVEVAGRWQRMTKLIVALYSFLNAPNSECTHHLVEVFVHFLLCYNLLSTVTRRGPDSSVGIATGYDLNGPGIESRWRDFPRLSRPALGLTQPPVQWVPSLSRG